MGSPIFNMDRGPKRNPAEDATALKRHLNNHQRDIQTWDYARVEEFDFATQTVSVRLLGDPDHPIIPNVPVWGGGGAMRFIWSLKTQARKGVDEYEDPDVGMILFPRLDSRGLLYDHEVSRPAPPYTHIPFRPIFIPGVPVNNPQQVTPNAAIANGWAVAGDKGWVDPLTGAGMIVKPDGSMDLRATAIYALAPGQERADADKVVKTGDSGDGGPGVGSLTGSGLLRVGNS